MLRSFLRGALAVAALSAASPAFSQSVVRISEVMADNVTTVAAGNSITDWVELINTSASPVDIGDASLTDDPLVVRKWIIPVGTMIPANGYLIILFSDELPVSIEPGPILNAGFNLNSNGDNVIFFGNDFSPIPWDEVSFGPQIGDFSIGRVNGQWRLGPPTPRAANTVAELDPPTNLKINEWVSNYPGEDDWFEIYHPGTKPVALGGLKVSDNFTIPDKHTIAPLSFIGTGLEAYTVFQADGNTQNGPDHVAFSLSSDGERIGLYNADLTPIDLIPSSGVPTDRFPAQAPGTSSGRLPDGTGNIVPFSTSLSMGKANFVAIPNIFVNELLSHTDPPLEDAVEFYNDTDQDLNIGGWWLSNKESEPRRYLIPAGTVIPARGYKVFYENEFNFTNTRIPFNFNSAHGDQVFLSQVDANGNLTGYRIGEEFEAAANGVSFGRHYTSVQGDYKFVAMRSLSFGVDNPASQEDFRRGQGAPNSGPVVGPVVFNEVHYNPASTDGLDNRIDEFIELHNITSQPVNLFHPTARENTWVLRNGISYIFPQNVTIPAFGYILIVSFDPVFEPVKASNFRALHQVPNNVAMFGPFGGDLNNNGDSLELYRPDDPQPAGRPDAGFVPQIRVDKVNYTDGSPWPAGADGSGYSIQRRNAGTFGNEPQNWVAAFPSVGSANSPELRDTDADGIPDVWETANGYNPNDPSDRDADTDGDNFTTLAEYAAGTNPRDATSYLKVDSLVPPRGGSLAQVTFRAQPDKFYSVEYKNSFQINSRWQKMVEVPPAANSRTVTVTDTNTVFRTDRYYRVRVD